jgi:hypothetical protein
MYSDDGLIDSPAFKGSSTKKRNVVASDSEDDESQSPSTVNEQLFLSKKEIFH